jgi:hypothetical protein
MLMRESPGIAVKTAPKASMWLLFLNPSRAALVSMTVQAGPR